MTLEKPVPFGNEAHDPVKLLIAIAAVDNSSHIDLIQNIATIFDCEEVVEQLKNSKTEQEILKIIRENAGGNE